MKRKFDKLITAMDKSGSFRVYMAVTTKMVNQAVEIHHTTPLGAHALGRALTGTAIMAKMLKNSQDKLTLQFKGDGPAAEILCTGYGTGDVKGYISNPDINLPNKEGAPDVGGALGIGTLTVIKDLGLKEPYVGKLDFVTGEIADDLTAYYWISEQQNSSVALGVKLSAEEIVEAAGGMIIQMLPDPDPASIDALEALLKTLKPISQIIADVLKQASEEESEQSVMTSLLTETFKELPEEYALTPLDWEDIQWNCDCSEERLEQVLMSLGLKDLRQLIEEDGQAELVCHFCETRYHFDKEHLERILAEAMGKYTFN